MVARVLKTSVYKILREANGFRGEQGAFLGAVKAQLMGDDRSREVRESDAIPSVEDTKSKNRRSKKMPSNEACRTALANFFSVIFARQYLPPEVCVCASVSVCERVRMRVRKRQPADDSLLARQYLPPVTALVGQER